MLKSFRSRILLGAVLATVVGVGGTVMVARQAVNVVSEGRRRVAAVMPSPSGRELEECAAASGHWRRLGGGAEVYAFDVERGRSTNPDAPPIPEDVLAELQGGAWEVLRTYPATGPVGGALFARTGIEGPCSAVVGRWMSSPQRRIRAIARLSFLGLGMLGISVCAGIALAVGPLVGRIRALQRSARGIGSPDYQPPVHEGNDALVQLGRELDRAHEEIIDNREALQARAMALEEHLAAVAHDLRTPVASMQLTLEDACDAVGPQIRPKLVHAIEDAVYVAALAENLRLVAELRYGLRERAVEFDLRDVVERVGRRFATLGRRREVDVDFAIPEHPAFVRADPVRVEQAIANIVHNAVVHGESGGHVALCLDTTAGGFCLVVRDDGPVQSRGDLAAVAEIDFGLLQPRPRATRGLGLGLAITREIVQRLDWTMAFESDDDGFCVRLEGASLRGASESADRVQT